MKRAGWFSGKLILLSMAMILSVTVPAYAFTEGDGLHSKEFGRVYPFSEGLAAFANANGKCGFMNEQGEVVIAPEWDMVSDFMNGTSVTFSGEVLDTGTAGKGSFRLIDHNGEYLTEAWAWMSENYDGFAAVKNEEGRFGIINDRGETVIEPEWDWTCTMSEDLFLVQRDGQYAYADHEGNIISDFRENYNGRYTEGRTFISGDNGLYACMDENQNLVTDYIYAAASYFFDGIALVQNPDGLYGYIGLNGEIISEPQWADAGDFSEGYSWVREATEDNDGLWYLIDEEGNVDWDTSFYFFAGQASDHMIKAHSMYPGDGFGYYDLQNKKYVRVGAENISDFHDGAAIVEMTDGFGAVDHEGNFLIPAEWDELCRFDQGCPVTPGRKGDDWYLVSRNGSEAVQIDLSGEAFTGDTQMDDAYLVRREELVTRLCGDWRLSFAGDQASEAYGDTDLDIRLTFRDDYTMTWHDQADFDGSWSIENIYRSPGEGDGETVYQIILGTERRYVFFMDHEDPDLQLLRIPFDTGLNGYFLRQESSVEKGYQSYSDAYSEWNQKSEAGIEDISGETVPEENDPAETATEGNLQGAAPNTIGRTIEQFDSNFRYALAEGGEEGKPSVEEYEDWGDNTYGYVASFADDYYYVMFGQPDEKYNIVMIGPGSDTANEEGYRPLVRYAALGADPGLDRDELDSSLETFWEGGKNETDIGMIHLAESNGYYVLSY